MFLSAAEADALLRLLRRRVELAGAEEQADAVTDELIVQCLLFSGLRNSEFCQLQAADTIVGVGQSVFCVQGTRNQDRTVYVPRAVSRLVRKYFDEVRPALLAEDTDPDDVTQPLLINDRGRAYERTGLYRRVLRILEGTGLEARASVQLFRHTYGVLGYQRTGGNLLFLQRQLGHVHPMVTSIYAQFFQEDYAALADTVGGEVEAPRSRRKTSSQSR
jgi:site-specific recombinase XerD